MTRLPLALWAVVMLLNHPCGAAELGAVPAAPKALPPHAAPVVQPTPAPSSFQAQRTFFPKTVMTGDINMTGQRFQPRRISTADISVTGLRFTPVVVETGEVTMTGLH